MLCLNHALLGDSKSIDSQTIEHINDPHPAPRVANASTSHGSLCATSNPVSSRLAPTLEMTQSDSPE
jgi:hypothetical protein